MNVNYPKFAKGNESNLKGGLESSHKVSILEFPPEASNLDRPKGRSTYAEALVQGGNMHDGPERV